MALNDTQYDGIMKEYEEIRDRNRHLTMDRREEAVKAIPELEELDRSVASLSVQSARLLLDGDESALAQLKESLAQIADRRKQLLTSHGFPTDCLEPIHTCPDCRDTGYVTRPDGTREKCPCFRRRELTLRYEQSNIQSLLKTENFSTLSSTLDFLLIPAVSMKMYLPYLFST